MAYLEFRSSSTSIVTIPNKLMYVCISGRFESMQSILEVSHWASYFWQTAMCLIGRSVAKTYINFFELCLSATGFQANGWMICCVTIWFTSVSLTGPICRSMSQMLKLWFSADTDMSSASRLVLYRRVLLKTENSLLKHLPSPYRKKTEDERNIKLCASL